MSEQPINPDVTSDDKLWALLTYVFTPIVPIIIMLMEDKKNRPFLRAHNAQALALGVINLVVGTLLSFTIILACVPFFIFLYSVYLGFKAYKGEYVTIPVITDFCKNKGWS